MNDTQLIKTIQSRLIAKGYDLGPAGADGIKGRMTTAAIAKFQADVGLDIKWPGTLGPKTIARIIGGMESGDVDKAVETNVVARPWYDLALRKKGMHEQRDHDEVAAFLKSDGKSVGDPAQLPWCGDFVETCIALTLRDEPLPSNPYLARNWLKFGVPCAPQLGAIMVYWRGEKNGISGHVAFCAGESSTNYYNLGGNQSNAVTIAPLVKSRLLGARWPRSVPIPSRLVLPQMVGGKLSTNEA